jgi:hypothetical protein
MKQIDKFKASPTAWGMGQLGKTDLQFMELQK